ncbi:MAG: Lrp/AsnC family transcriptional regulator [Candidatus Aenigmarchaeota archaeon]|nr:Lrp/AsnC family transcriptional regulator [Candidatus Aenigmarchaeota archaeon]
MMALSDNEKKVLRSLTDNPLASNYTIATQLSMHHATVSAIRKKLEEIFGLSYKIDINPVKSGLDGVYLIYFMFDSHHRSGEDFSSFFKAAQKIESVVGMGLVTHSTWDGWIRIAPLVGESDRTIFDVKKELGRYIDRFEIIKHADAVETGANDMLKLLDLL